ncbi:hypothetical protein N7513_008542 [Penicillium frequentans]|nr:hypothetical protein N7513_008542 [Penicillium glabrum]
MSVQPGSPGSSTFIEILYEVEPPNNIRQYESNNETINITFNIALQLHITHRASDPSPQGQPNGSLSTAGHKIQQALGGPAADYQTVWGTNAGGVAFLHEPSRFLLQTPHDNDDIWSFGAKAPTTSSGERYFEGTLIHAGPDCIDHSLYAWQIAQDWASTDLPLTVIPLTLLQIHVDRTSVKLTELIRRVEGVERNVLESSGTTDFDPLIRALHACDADLIKLERRWHFEKELTAAVLDVIGRYKQPETNYQEVHFNSCDISPTDNGWVNINLANSSDRIQGSEFRNTKPFKVLDSVAILQEQRSRAFGYDLGVLPRRIQDQFTAVYNLVAQRDARATHDLAKESAKIAEATLRDSSSMKTIAVMTLVFLPATFACSFFSMSFFDWVGNPTDSHSDGLMGLMHSKEQEEI